jgi:hypothetical protein
MPKPFSGLAAVEEFGSKFDADVAIGALRNAGIEAIASFDPALNSVAGYMASERTVDVLVREEDLEPARAVLDELTTTLPAAFSDEAVGDWPRATRQRTIARRAILVCLVSLLASFVIVAVLIAAR